MRILFLFLFSCILCGKAWAQPRSYPLSWGTSGSTNTRTEATAIPYTTTLKLPYVYDFSSKYLQIKHITNGSTVMVLTTRPHGLITNDAVFVSAAISPVTVSGIKYINRISDYQFQLFDDPSLSTATSSPGPINYLRINKVGAKETLKPDTLAFYDNKGGVTITGGTAKKQLSYWTARFDGLDGNGVPYSTNPTLKGYTDSLRSQRFDFSTYTPADSLYMSFYYQHGGYGELPDAADHFYLEFLDNTFHWNVKKDVTGTTGGSDTTFYRVMVPIDSVKYFHNAFQYRFRSYGRQAGAYDVWNLDYIYLNKNRTFKDTTLLDLAIRDGDQTFLKGYTAMPFDHFFNGYHDDDIFFKNVIKTTVSNQSRFSKPKNVFATVVDQAGNIIATAQSADEQSPYLDSTYTNTLTPISFPVRTPQYVDLIHGLNDVRRSDDSVATLKMDMMFNNIITKRTYLYDYYAYDDSEAEAGFGSNYSGVEIAYQFTSQRKDSLTHVDLSFTNNKDGSLENFQIYLMVWGETLVVDDSHPQLYKEPISVHYPSTINGFVRYKLNTPIAIDSAKKFHIGYRKNFAQLLSVGYDRNIDSRSKSFYKESTQWFGMNDTTNSGDPLVDDAGSMMIRPVFYKASSNVPVGIHPAQEDNKNKLLLYPNPATTTIDIVSTDELSNLNYTMYSLYGQIVLSGSITATEHTINVAQLSSGLYLIRCTDEKGTVYTTRFIKE